MPSLRIHFPQKDEPTVLAFTGNRVTVGRRPDNTIQILDRTVSAFHAELVAEDGHYRLRDLDSANGISINGERVTDYHLRESCRISFGSLECEFSPELPSSDTKAETLPSHGEVTAVKRENMELRKQLETARWEVETLRQVRTMSPDEAPTGVSREELEKVVALCEDLKEAQSRRDEELHELKDTLRILRRDRENLQRAYDSARAELERLQKAPGTAPDTAIVALPKETGSRAPEEEAREIAPPTDAAPSKPAPTNGLPKPPHELHEAPAKPQPQSAPAAPVAPSAPSVPAAPIRSTPAVPTPRPTSAPALAPAANRPAVSSPATTPVIRSTVKPATAAPRVSGAGGTQKISMGSLESAAPVPAGAPAAGAAPRVVQAAAPRPGAAGPRAIAKPPVAALRPAAPAPAAPADSTEQPQSVEQ